MSNSRSYGGKVLTLQGFCADGSGMPCFHGGHNRNCFEDFFDV